MNVIFYVSDTHCCGHIRGEELARQVNGKTKDTIIIKSDVLMSDYQWADVMIFQRQMNKQVLMKMRYAKNLGIKTVYDVDDNLFLIPDVINELHSLYQQEEVRDTIKKFLNECDLITVPSMTLAKSMRQHCNTDICVLNNGINPDDWTHKEDDKIKIGWMGSQTHVKDAKLVSDALKAVLDDSNAYLKLIGWVSSEEAFAWAADHPKVELCEWVEINSLPSVMADFDIGLCPIEDTEFNRCKSNIKWLQTGVMGIPCVVSGIPPYTDDVVNGVNGFCANTPQEWYDTIMMLVHDEATRNRVGLSAMREIREKHTTNRRAQELLAALRGM